MGARSDDYQRKFDVLNRGYGGYNSEMVRKAFDVCLSIFFIIFRIFYCSYRSYQFLVPKKEQSRSPALRMLIIWLGTNDSCKETKDSSPQRVPLERYAKNLEWYIDAIHKKNSNFYSPNTKILVITPAAVDEENWWTSCLAPMKAHNDLKPLKERIEIKQNHDNEVTKLYAEKAVAIAKGRPNVAVVNAYTLMREEAAKQQKRVGEFLMDGLHLNAEGHNVRHVLRSIDTSFTLYGVLGCRSCMPQLRGLSRTSSPT